MRISPTSPAGRRRRAQAQRRSLCCCSVMLLLCLALVIIAFRGVIGRVFHHEPEEPRVQVQFPLRIETAQGRYLRYHLVPVTVRVVDAQGRPLTHEPPRVTVRHGGEIVGTVGHFDRRVVLSWDEEAEAWTGWWPPGWNPDAGPYTLEAKVNIDPAQWSWEDTRAEEEEGDIEPEGEAWAVATTPFEVVARQRPEMEPGLCVATWEFDFSPRFRGPDGSGGDWRTLFDWVEYVGADALWFRGAVTSPPEDGLTLERPFKPLNLEAIPKLGAEAHRRGLKFGTWAVAYATYGRRRALKPDYDYSLDISRSTGETSETDYVSLYDERRIEHLADFFRRMQASEHVDMVGLDYLRTDPGSGGYELVERFAREMPVELPDGWDGWSETRRQRYVAVKVEREWQTDPDFFQCWNWWRAHMGAGIVRRILDRSGVEKPTWIFVLSWWHGMEHGQDALMFTDAGITMLAPMLYQIEDREQFDIMVRQWQDYLREGQANIVPGDQVDFRWHDRTKDPPAPAELYERMVAAHRGYIDGEPTRGAFWHDINRAANPHNLGPYSGREWALAGAAAFSTLRESWQVYPLRAELEAPDRAGIGSAFTVKVNVENLTNQPVEGVRVALCDTPHMVGIDLTEPADGEGFGEPFTNVGTVPAGESVAVPVRVRITTADAERLNETMLALRVTWDEGQFEEPVRNELPRTIVVMKYITGA